MPARACEICQIHLVIQLELWRTARPDGYAYLLGAVLSNVAGRPRGQFTATVAFKASRAAPAAA
jgi:hypothetical protein